MPTIACSTRAVASSDHNGVALAARHYLTAAEATETIHDTKCKLPSIVDILASSTVTLVLHGSLMSGTYAGTVPTVFLEQMDIEYRLAAKIYYSITSIISRSSNNAFREACGRLLKKLHRQRKAAARSSASALQEYMGPAYDAAQVDEGDTDEDDNDEDGEHLADLQFAMQRLYRATVKKPRFKGSHQGRPSRESDAEDEELTRLPSPKGRRSSDTAQAAQDLLDTPDLGSGDESTTTGPPLTLMDDDALWVGLEPVSPSRKELVTRNEMEDCSLQEDVKMFSDDEGIVDDENIADDPRMPCDDHYGAFDAYGDTFDGDEWEGAPDPYVYFHHCALDEFDAGLGSHSDMSVYESDDSLLLDREQHRADDSDDEDDAYTSLVDAADDYPVSHAAQSLLDERDDAIDIDTDENARSNEPVPSRSWMPTQHLSDDEMLSDEDLPTPQSLASTLMPCAARVFVNSAAQPDTVHDFDHDLLDEADDEEQPPILQEPLAADTSDFETDGWDFDTSTSTPASVPSAAPFALAPVHPSLANLDSTFVNHESTFVDHEPFPSVIYPPEATATYSPESASIKSPEPSSPIEALDSSSCSSLDRSKFFFVSSVSCVLDQSCFTLDQLSGLLDRSSLSRAVS
ncbi:hypothetical protein EV121DRAFT_288450 [Schizophyllum commune]